MGGSCERDPITKSEIGAFCLPTAAPESPAAPSSACLILLHPAGPEMGRRIPLSADEYVMGRVEAADIVVPRESVSRRHALLACEQGGWFIEDLSSTNGSFVNEARVVRQALSDGDQLRIGDAIYKFLGGANVESAYHEEIYRMAVLDGLTGVHNKRYLIEFLDREISGHSRRGQALALVMFDVDHFKAVNDERGHLAGDSVLKQMSARIAERIRREDLLARYGGEEFAAVLTATDLRGAMHFAECLRGRVGDAAFEFDGEKIHVTISLGLASTKGERGISPEALIARADEKLYAAKRSGRNRSVG
jgi:diguanylate cyclase (GGDEF)-like protein